MHEVYGVYGQRYSEHSRISHVNEDGCQLVCLYLTPLCSYVRGVAMPRLEQR